MKIDFWRLLPPYWIQNRPTCWHWDAMLNHLLDNYEVELGHSDYAANLGPVEVWVGNWPYAYGSPYSELDYVNRMPSVGTRKRLRRAVEAAKAKRFRTDLTNLLNSAKEQA